ncbi:MAG: aminotransferase class V-fold PLP-dependent enzyme [Actinobacteria bacterium]|nr:MAG: aminotransferase class V-fold PLP-dependent enzyme [Actinomycetota bacterium]
MESDRPDPLELDAATMRELGYRVVDLLVDRIAGLGESPAWCGATRREMEERLREPPPPHAEEFDRLVARLGDDVLPFAGHHDHPRFFAFIPSCPTWPGILGELVAGGANVFQGTWLQSAGASEIELVVLDWFKEWIGYPAQAAGLLVSGGSVANLTALACAREARIGTHADDAVLYLSSEGHSSVVRAARVLGFEREQLRVLPTDESRRLAPKLVAAAVDADLRAGRRPFALVANGGTTNTGAVDPIANLAAVCADLGLWLHVDGAYGGFAVLTDRGRTLLDGIGLADSVALDPHKWLYQPYEAGCLLVRDGDLLRQTFQILPDYLQDTAVDEGEINFADLGVQLTRSARGIKIWLSLKTFGVDAFRVAIDRSLDLAVLAEEWIRAAPELELISPAVLGIVCFRRRFQGVEDELELEQANAGLVRVLNRSGEGMISSTRLDGRYVLRLCMLNHRSGPEDVERILERLTETPLTECS